MISLNSSDRTVTRSLTGRYLASLIIQLEPATKEILGTA